MKDSPPFSKRRRYDAAYRAEALRLASESRSTQAAARALNIDPKRLCKRIMKRFLPMAAARGAELDPATAAELRQLRATNRRQAQELDLLKKCHRQQTLEARYLADTGPVSCCRFTEAQRHHDAVRLLCQMLSVPASGYYAWKEAQQQRIA